MRAWW